MDKKKAVSLGWEDFVKLGNPENAPEISDNSNSKPIKNYAQQPVKLHYEKKGRGGKEAIIIRGLDSDKDDLDELCKLLKSKLGVGGAIKDGEIIIQGNQRDKILQIMLDRGYKNVKKAGG